MAAGGQVAIIGASLDLGAGRRGVDMGPSAIRYAGLEERLTGLGYRCVDWGNVETAVLEATEEQDERARYLPQILAACGQVAGFVGRALERGSDAARARRRPLRRDRHTRRARARRTASAVCSGSTPTAT